MKRHNGNILIDNFGHCIHIDFGFMLSNSPGSVGFELAPFKLTSEYIELLDGSESNLYREYVDLFTDAFLSVRKKADWIVGLVELMEHGSRLPCFTGVTKPTKEKDGAVNQKVAQKSVSAGLRERFQLGMTDAQIADHVEKLMQSSAMNSFSVLYDTFQVILKLFLRKKYYTNDVLY